MRTSLRSPVALLLAALAGCDPTVLGPKDETGDSADSGPLAFDVVDEGHAPLDASPSADGSEIWFLGTAEGEPTLFHVDAEGETTVALSGDPLVAPENLSVAADDGSIFIADPGAEGDGGVHVVSPDGAVLDLLASGMGPRGVHAEADGSVLFSWAVLGSAGVSRATGAELETLATGAPIVAPSGVVSTPDGVVFVADGPGVAGGGALRSVSGGVVTTLLDGLTLGDPAGLSSTLDGAVLVISAIDPETGNDAVILYDRASGSATYTSEGIEGNTAAGGVHRAADANIWAWADSEAGGGGRAYRVGLN